MATAERVPVGVLGDRIKRARLDAGLTQDRLAERLGTTRARVIEWEKGRQTPSPSSREKIVRAVGRPDLFDPVEAASG